MENCRRLPLPYKPSEKELPIKSIDNVWSINPRPIAIYFTRLTSLIAMCPLFFLYTCTKRRKRHAKIMLTVRYLLNVFGTGRNIISTGKGLALFSHTRSTP